MAAVTWVGFKGVVAVAAATIGYGLEGSGGVAVSCGGTCCLGVDLGEIVVDGCSNRGT